MNSRPRFSTPARSIAFVVLCAGLLPPASQPLMRAASAEGNVPAPAQALNSRAVLVFYADLQGASKTAIWKAMSEKAGPIAEQLQAAPPGPMPSLHSLPGLKALTGTNVAEIAVVLEGEKILSGLQSEKLDPDSGFIVVIRLARTEDSDHLIQQVFEVIDQAKPGLRGQIEKSRRRVGAADYFDLPSDVLGEEKLPFGLGCAIGPGKDGTVIALGRSENLRAFLSGQTDGKLKNQKNEALSRKGQMWFYLAVPKDAAKNLGPGGAGGANGNPMLAGLAQGMEKGREVDLSLNFGASQVGFELELGCADAAAATEFAQGVQGFLGIIQMSAQQNPSSMPPFVGKIKSATEGAAFRMTTVLTLRDLDLALKNINHGSQVARGRPSTQVPATTAPVAPPPPAAAPAAPPVEVEFVKFDSDH